MFGLNSGGLFQGRSLPEEAAERQHQAVAHVDRVNADELLGRDLDLLSDELTPLFGTATPLWDEVTMTEPKQTSFATVDVFQRPVRIPQLESVITVQVQGDASLFSFRSHRGAPMGEIGGKVSDNTLSFNWTGGLETDSGAIKQWLDECRRRMEPFVNNNNADVPPLNDQMRSAVRAALEERRNQELQRRRVALNLPFPMTRQLGATRLVKAERRRVQLRPATASPATPFSPEPELSPQVYDEILSDCVAMATVFERMPLASGTEEDHLRNTILGMLNTNYSGDAAGEMFNGNGKTDILVRRNDRNVFIGECKFYKGPASVTKAIDQLLGYLVWRDTKAALLLFVRNGNFTEVVQKANTAAAEHPQCRRAVGGADPARRSDYVFTRAEDPDRAIRLALLPFRLTTDPGTDRH